MNQEPRLVFGEDAVAYDRARPSYPAEAIDRIVDLAALEAGDLVVEVGAGTGIATTLLANRRLLVTALEPDPAMAGILSARGLVGVDVQVIGFEEWSPAERTRAVVSAQAWHWLDQGAAPHLAADALAPGGWVALLWNRPAAPDPELDEVYARLVPQIADTTVVGNPAQRGAETRAAAGIEASARFGRVLQEEVTWEQAYATREWLDLISTHSDHRLLLPDVRERLYEAVHDVLERRGGRLLFPYVTRLVAACANDPG